VSFQPVEARRKALRKAEEIRESPPYLKPKICPVYIDTRATHSCKLHHLKKRVKDE